MPKILNLNAERNSSLGNPTWDPLTIHLMILLYKYQKKKSFFELHHTDSWRQMVRSEAICLGSLNNPFRNRSTKIL